VIFIFTDTYDNLLTTYTKVESGSRISLQLEWSNYLGTILTEGNDNNDRHKATNTCGQ